MYVPRGVVVDRPLHIGSTMTDGGTDTTHTLIVLDEGAEATVLHESNSLDEKIDADDVLPESRAYAYYEGSLTTPPCSEGVRWLVMEEPITMSVDQIAALKKAIGFDNNRPVQPLNGRVIYD